MRSLVLVLCLTASAWCEEPFARQLASGFGTALSILVVGAASMWLLFAYVQKFGGMGATQPWSAHKVEDVGPIDRQKANAFAEKERAAMREPFVDTYKYPDWSQADYS
ncbi:hypothetical protein JST97_14075 [bacterium]|nr:hypothetical protein [bacterium]